MNSTGAIGAYCIFIFTLGIVVCNILLYHGCFSKDPQPLRGLRRGKDSGRA